MLQHSLVLIFRSFKRFKSSFFINLLGLSTGLASTMLIYLWVQDELAFDRFHVNDKHLYRVMEKQRIGDDVVVGFRTSGPVAETLKEEVPEIEFAAPAITSSWFPKFILSASDEVNQKATGQFVGSDYLSIFSFNLMQGDKTTALTDKNAIVISDELAMKLFNTTESILGKTISLQLADLELQTIITGVFAKVPDNSSEKFDFLLTFASFKDISPAVTNWGNNGTDTYVVIREGADITRINQKIANLVEKKHPGAGRTLFLTPYADLYLHGNYENGEQVGGRITYVRLFSLVAIFILLIASINFMNLSTAKASRRIKEVGIKKAIGASRRTLILQYLGESMLMAFISLVVASVLVELLLPQFNMISGKHLSLGLDINLIVPMLSITVITGLISGSYPALYLSKFSPALVLKGKLHTSLSELITRKGLVVFQYTISVILIVAVIVIYKQIEFVQSKNLGYNKENIIYFEKEGSLAKNTQGFLAELKNTPGIVDASSMWGNLIGGYSTTGDVTWPGKNPDERTAFQIMNADYGLLELLDIKMVSGRSFSYDFGTDTTKVIFNQAAISLMGLKDPIGQVVNIWGVDLEIIGVAEDFHFQSLHESVKPLFIRLQPQNTSMFMVKIEADKEKEAIAGIQELYKTYNPGFTFDYKFLDQEYQAQYAAETQVATLSQGFATLAIIISSLGLFGLSAFTAERRVKEIGIRKVLGSSELGIIILLSKDFTKIVIIAILFALPLSYLLVDNWLSSFAYKINLSWLYFVGAGAIALSIAWLTVGTQAIKAAKINAIDSLRSE